MNKKDKTEKSKIGYIDNDVAISHHCVGDDPNIGIVQDEDGNMGVIAGKKPDFIIHPITKKRVNITDMFTTDRDTKCPKGHLNGSGVIIRVLENRQMIYECPICKEFHFCVMG